TDEYLLLVEITPDNCHLLKKPASQEQSLLWMTAGGNQLNIDGRDYTFEENEVVCLTQFHRLNAKKVSSLRMVRFNRPFFCVIDRDSEVGCKGILFFGASQLPVFRIPAGELEKFDLLWRMFCIEMQSRDSLQIEMLQMMLKRLLILSTRLYKAQKMAGTASESTQIDLIREYNFLVEQHFKTKHTVAEYAKMLHKSPKTISNLFSRFGAKTPLQLIQERKMLEARRLLHYADMPVKEIAYELGYEDLQTFSRFFKAQEGVSPSEFREGILR
ncbi:MAG: helix-turn-helix domain-containing protein, partial [Thermoanaerobaculia bacterium]|nr:helix-turn-helix domain-containing protein [Thermoanaerobaculia bacterium]